MRLFRQFRLRRTRRLGPELPPGRVDWRGESGDAVIELALIIGIFGPALLLGTVEMATVVYDSIEVANAAYAGAIYGMRSATFASNTTGITSAAQAEASDFGTHLTVTPTTYYACSAAIAGTQYTTQSAASAACSGSGNHALQFIQVQTSGSITPAFHFPKLPASFTVKGSSVMEVAE
jgi:Flp pilus assembly protein TadG